jgi:hypothetical protein
MQGLTPGANHNNNKNERHGRNLIFPSVTDSVGVSSLLAPKSHTFIVQSLSSW